MAHVHVYHSYKLIEGKSEQDFLRVAEQLSNDSVLKAKGFISWTCLKDDDLWSDILVYESMDDFLNTKESIEKNPLVDEFCSFIDMSSITTHCFTVMLST